MTQNVEFLSHIFVLPAQEAFSILGRSNTIETTETSAACNLALEFHHALLVASGVLRVCIKNPLEVLVGIVGDKVRAKDSEALAVLGHLAPVALDILEVLGEVGEASLEDLPVKFGTHDWFEIDIFSPGSLRLTQNKVGGALDSTKERANLFRVLGQEVVIGDVEDGAETAAPKLGELVDTEHLDIRLGSTLACEPLFKLNHLDIFQANTSVNLARLDGLGDVHAAANRSVVVRGESIVRSELVNLNLSKFADVANALALEGAEVCRDARVFEVDNTCERLVQKASDGSNREVASLSLWERQSTIRLQCPRIGVQQECESWP